MKRQTLGLIWVALALPSSICAIDFTPTLTVKKLERFNVPVLTFNSGERRVSYKPPVGWKSTGTEQDLTLKPQQPSGASMKFVGLEWSVERTAKIAAAEDEKKWALSFLPADATEVAVVTTNESPYMLGVQSSREWIVKYRLDGIVHETSVSRCDISAKERILILITAKAQDFDTFRQDGISSLFSWEWL